MIEQIVMHEIPVALMVCTGKAHIFIHIEGDNVLKAYLAAFACLCQALVDADRAGAGRQAENKGTRLVIMIDRVDDMTRRPFTHVFIVFLNQNSHFVSFPDIFMKRAGQIDSAISINFLMR